MLISIFSVTTTLLSGALAAPQGQRYPPGPGKKQCNTAGCWLVTGITSDTEGEDASIRFNLYHGDAKQEIAQCEIPTGFNTGSNFPKKGIRCNKSSIADRTPGRPFYYVTTCEMGTSSSDSDLQVTLTPDLGWGDETFVFTIEKGERGVKGCFKDRQPTYATA